MRQGPQPKTITTETRALLPEARVLLCALPELAQKSIATCARLLNGAHPHTRHTNAPIPQCGTRARRQTGTKITREKPGNDEFRGRWMRHSVKTAELYVLEQRPNLRRDRARDRIDLHEIRACLLDGAARS